MPVAETVSLPRYGAPSTEMGSAAENVYGGCRVDRAARASAPLSTSAPGASFVRRPAESVTVQGASEVSVAFLAATSRTRTVAVFAGPSEVPV